MSNVGNYHPTEHYASGVGSVWYASHVATASDGTSVAVEHGGHILEDSATRFMYDMENVTFVNGKKTDRWFRLYGPMGTTDYGGVYTTVKVPKESYKTITINAGVWRYLVNKGHSAQTILGYWRVDIFTDSKCTDRRNQWLFTIYSNVDAKPSYTVSFNANGGSGAPGNQTKWYNESLTLSSTKPSRTNYVFKNWNTASNGSGTTYNSGGSYSGNSGLTLYAQWYAPYTVSYNANGGSGAPGSQTKVYNTTLTLTSSKPTRTNYVFKNWNTAANGSGTSYSSGGSYTANANVTLYAQWYAPYTVTFNANGGSGAPGNQTKVYNTNLTLSSTKPTRSGYRFVRWNTNTSNTGTGYTPGQTYSTNANLTLYAIWEEIPTVTLTATRCNQAGGADEMGAYMKLAGSWSVDTKYTCSSIVLSCNSVSQTITPSGTSGSYSQVLSISGRADRSYTATATITDSSSHSQKTASASASSSTAYFAPRITAVNGYRVDSSGTPADEGTLIAVDVNWSVSVLGSQKRPTSLAVEVREKGKSPVVASQTKSQTAFTEGVSSGTASFLVGVTGTFDSDTTYMATVTLHDSINDHSAIEEVSAAFFTMDLLGDSKLYELSTDTVASATKTYYRESEGSYGSVDLSENDNLMHTVPDLEASSEYRAYEFTLDEWLEAEQTYTLQLWDVDVSQSGKASDDVGIAVYYCGGAVRIGGWYVSGGHFTDGHADHLVMTFTMHASEGATTSTSGEHTYSGGTGNLSNNDVVSGTHPHIVLWNSTPDVTGTKNLTVDSWKLEKGSTGTGWSNAVGDFDPSDEGWYERTGPRPGHGVAFGAPAVHESFNIAMPPECFGEPWIPTYKTNSIANFVVPNGVEECIVEDCNGRSFYHYANDTRSPITLAYKEVSSLDANNCAQGFYQVRGAITNAPMASHGGFVNLTAVGTPYQLYIPDASQFMYKRHYTSGAWTEWYIPMAGGLRFGNYNAVTWKKDTTGGGYGEGIVIGAGGATVIGGGESAQTMANTFTSGDSEVMYICNDNGIAFYPDCQNGAPGYPKFRMTADGDLWIQHNTANSIGSGSVGAKITFLNVDGSQWGRFIFTDYDVVETGASVTFITNQSQSWFRVQNLRAYGQGYSPKWNTTSDKRLKDHIAYLGKEAVKFVKSLLPAKFKMNDETKLGFYAQDIEGDEIYGTDMVSTTGEDEIRSLDYNQLIAPLVAAVQDLTQRVEELEERIGE